MGVEGVDGGDGCQNDDGDGWYHGVRSVIVVNMQMHEEVCW